MKKKLLALVINIIVMGVVLVLIVYGVFQGIDKFTRHGEAIIVPDVKGLSVAEAESVFKRYGLNCLVSDSTYVRDEVPGRVLDYIPSVGKQVKKGRTIYLNINTKSVPLLPVPDVADNSSARQARARILSVGFKLTEDEYISGQKDWVYEVKYRGQILPISASAPVGATLTLVVGDGTTESDVDSLEVDLENTDGLTEKSTVDESWFN
ncbi:PASTA domain-containing protein [Bacteroides propionicifaciens]|jgi:eukaryotic-like serine/threonine-protein kinase|uniref:PASTA domain-containing protein n=1 Tax=Bacteroides propionicifaciens TaxID=392838 RepID=UPI000370CD4A|nr:PASTA domain-containing protein [Bacteroides propionicifaciens]